MGEGARKAKYKVLGHVVKKKFSFDTYLITLPSNTSNILDIYSANVLLQLISVITYAEVSFCLRVFIFRRKFKKS